MRRINAQVFATLDGVMQAPGGPQEDPSGGFAHGGWSFNYWDAGMGEAMTASMAEPYDLLLGRRTYDIFAAHWPRSDDPVVAPKFNAAAKYVATSSPDTLGWENSHALTGDIAGAVAALKAGDGPDLSVQGSSQLLQLLFARDLVDGLWLWTFPLVLGGGKRVFEAGTGPVGLSLVDSRTSSTGVVMARYARAEVAPVGSFALE